MGMSISFKKATNMTSIKHNNRDFKKEDWENKYHQHINPDFTAQNIVIKQEDIKAVYQKLFQSVVDEYNQKQKRADRKIDDYYSKIKHSKGYELQREFVVQVGQKSDFENGIESENWQTANQILKSYAENFQKENPNLYVYNAVIHNDEVSPHLHLNVVPIATGYKTGVKIRPSFDKALKGQLGDKKGDSRELFRTYRDKQVKTLEMSLNEHGIDRDIKNTNKIKDVREYKNLVQETERLALDKYNELTEHYNQKAEEYRQKLQKQLDDLKNQRTSYQKENTELEQEISDKKQELSVYEEKSQKMQSKSLTLENKINDLTEHKNGLERQILANKSDLKQISQQIKHKQNHLAKSDYKKTLFDKFYKKFSNRNSTNSKAREILPGKVISNQNYDQTLAKISELVETVDMAKDIGQVFTENAELKHQLDSDIQNKAQKIYQNHFKKELQAATKKLTTENKSLKQENDELKGLAKKQQTRIQKLETILYAVRETIQDFGYEFKHKLKDICVTFGTKLRDKFTQNGKVNLNATDVKNELGIKKTPSASKKILYGVNSDQRTREAFREKRPLKLSPQQRKEIQQAEIFKELNRHRGKEIGR
ncbi:plasmid recombination protein [Holzapfeliella sp. JNUCC 80]